MDDNNNNNHLPINESIRLANEALNELLKTNEFNKTLQKIEPFCDQSIYHCFGRALAMIMIAVTRMDKTEIEMASDSVQELQKMTNRFRRTGFMASVIKIISTPNYQKYTDLEVHSEMIHCYSIGLSAGVMALNTHNIYGLIKCAYRGQKFLNRFNACKAIRKYKTEWESHDSQQNFEASVRLVNGYCHLAISKIPPKILRVANFLGYGGVESVGWEEVNKAAFQLPGMFSLAARGSLIGYWLYAEPHGLLGPKNLDICARVLQSEMNKYPRNFVLICMKTKMEQVKGNIDLAIQNCNKLIEESDDRVHKALYVELIQCHALKCEWNECIKYAQVLRKTTVHSPAMATYGEAIVRYAKYLDDDDPDEKAIATQLIETVPSLRIRHLGKTITPEKVAVVNAEKYMKNDGLILPVVEVLYQTNGFIFIKRDQILMNRHLARIEKTINRYKDDIKNSDYLDNYLTAVFYKGVICRLQEQFTEAKNLFRYILDNEPRFGREFSIPPQTCLELGLTELDSNNSDEAKQWLNKAINDYSGYTNENYVHIRAYAGLRELGVCTDKHEANEEKLEEYKKQWLKDMKVEENRYESIIQNEDSVIVQ